MGFVILMIIVAYLLISAGVVSAALLYAQKHGKSAIRWGASAALVMFLIPCWDWIPTVVAHKYYCEKEAGFWVYKTLEQWKADNPGVMEGLVYDKSEPISRQGDMVNYVDTYFVNQRINLVVKREGKFQFNRWRHEREVMDKKNGAVLARYIDFSTSQDRPQAGWSGWKLWLDSRDCIGGRDQLIGFGKFYLEFRGAKK